MAALASKTRSCDRGPGRRVGPLGVSSRRRPAGCRRIGSRGVGVIRGGWMATEYLQFGGALVLFLGILVGSYWFVYAPSGGRKDEKDQRQAGN